MSAGSLRSAAGHTFLHRWTPEGVTVETDFTGAHLLHLAAAGCVLNDVYREAVGLGIALNGVLVRAAGGFDTTTWHSTCGRHRCGDPAGRPSRGAGSSSPGRS